MKKQKTINVRKQFVILKKKNDESVTKMLLRTKYYKIEPAAAAIIMAFGIFFIGAMEYFPHIDAQYGKLGAWLLIGLWIIIYTLLSWQFFQRAFFYTYISHPVQTFTIGTWIAGVSVLCNVLLKYFPQTLIITSMALINICLWLFFFIICIRNFVVLWKNKHDYTLDGAILLSTVGIQSIVILLHTLYEGFPVGLSIFVIWIGMLFYIASIYLMIRYYTFHTWTVKDQWANTNCIIHGALSISGLAWLTVYPIPSIIIQIFWWIVCCLLILVEVIEVIRVFQRIIHYGIGHGIGIYHVSQWSRNFTFGMFFAFTWKYVQIFSADQTTWQTAILNIWIWIVIVMLCVESILFCFSKGIDYLLSKKG